MSARLQLTKMQIMLLKLYQGYRELDHALASHHPLTPSLKWNPAYFVERGRKQAEKELKNLRFHIRNLERYHYVERVKEGGKRLYRLTSKGAFEVLRLRLAEHMMGQKKKPWDKKWRVLIFDVKEEMKKHRDFLRRLLKSSGFQIWQLSVWVNKYNPEPALGILLKYLDLDNCYAIIEADCKSCNPRIVRKFRQMRRVM